MYKYEQSTPVFHMTIAMRQNGPDCTYLNADVPALSSGDRKKHKE